MNRLARTIVSILDRLVWPVLAILIGVGLYILAGAIAGS